MRARLKTLGWFREILRKGVAKKYKISLRICESLKTWKNSIFPLRFLSFNHLTSPNFYEQVNFYENLVLSTQTFHQKQNHDKNFTTPKESKSQSRSCYPQFLPVEGCDIGVNGNG
jgi:hypothetical protein